MGRTRTSVPCQAAGDTDFRVTVYEADLDHIAAWVLDHPAIETGGNLFGFWTHSGSPAIQVVLGPGPGARHQSAAFFQDVDYLRDSGERLQHDHGLQHIGDWHSHHRIGLDRPSGGDAATVHRTLQTNGFPRFLTCIATLRDADDVPPGEGVRRVHASDGRSARRGGEVVVLHAYLFEAGRAEPRRGSWSVLSGRSPISTTAERAGATRPTPRQTGPWWVVPGTTRTAVRHAEPTAWYSTGWGRDFLLRLDEIGRRAYPSTAITVNTDSGELAYRFTTGGGQYAVAFPDGFPDRRPELVSPDGGREPVDTAHPDRPGELLREVRGLTGRGATEDPHTHPTSEERTDVMDPAPAAAAGAGEADPGALLPDPDVVQSD
ncbi:JAB domain-containing protein [Micromonospora rifamycinica]|uniref:JAB domain-containing protein n=1 Tax=Micromonospora rifamycinica TaxID=291594 RepID=A0A1C5JVQ3_9ACTN|nr:JAB domain-containing protein [Micromonospora rifamycinica]